MHRSILGIYVSRHSMKWFLFQIVFCIHIFAQAGPYRFLSMLSVCELISQDNNISSRISSAKYFFCPFKLHTFSVLPIFCMYLRWMIQNFIYAYTYLCCVNISCTVVELTKPQWWHSRLECSPHKRKVGCWNPSHDRPKFLK